MTTTPEPKPEKVAKAWDCSNVYEPTPSPDPTATPVVGQSCTVTGWYTPDPAPTETVTETAAPTSTATATVTADATTQEVVLAPAQWEEVDAWADSTVFAVGGALMLLIAFAVWVFSRPATFGFTGRRH